MGCSLACPLTFNKVKNDPKETRSKKVPYRLNSDDKAILMQHWIPTVLSQEPDIFLQTMLMSIEDSPKLLEVISCKMHDPALSNIAHWPKLQKMARGNCAFFTRQIATNRLDERLVRQDSEKLGAIHIQYAPYGFKPTFLDIWQQNMIKLVEQCIFPSDIDRLLFIKAFKTFCTFLCTLMIMEYEDSMQVVRQKERMCRPEIFTIST